jgi:dUTP pyrophosphatase
MTDRIYGHPVWSAAGDGEEPRNDWQNVRVKVFRINPLAKLPEYAHPGDSGMDLQSMIDVELSPGTPVKIHCGIALALPEGYEAQIRPRSSLSAKGIYCAFGTIDRGYTGELAAVLTLQAGGGGAFEFLRAAEIKAGDRIAQLVIAPVAAAMVEEVDSAEALGETQRGAAGFGSTGTR